MYGDYLYAKQDYNQAILQYIRTIGSLEPSYVIRRYLNAQRLANLSSYLEALHEKDVATSEHTTLLLNCYTKLKDLSKLDNFLQAQSQQTVNFDVDTAIHVLHTHYPEQALKLAKQHQEHTCVDHSFHAHANAWKEGSFSVPLGFGKDVEKGREG